MSFIRNLIKEPIEKTEKRVGDDNEDDDDEVKKPRPMIKSAIDLQRLRLEKLMKNPDKPVVIPEPPSEKDYMQSVPTFVRNVMGSSAGAGSGEFHVYRHLRRKEYARQKTIQAKSMREKLDEEYQQKLEENRRKSEEKTAKKRAKRLKRKQRAKKHRTGTKDTADCAKDDEESNDTSEDDVEEKEAATEQELAEDDEKKNSVIGESQNGPDANQTELKDASESDLHQTDLVV